MKKIHNKYFVLQIMRVVSNHALTKCWSHLWSSVLSHKLLSERTRGSIFCLTEGKYCSFRYHCVSNLTKPWLQAFSPGLEYVFKLTKTKLATTKLPLAEFDRPAFGVSMQRWINSTFLVSLRLFKPLHNQNYWFQLNHLSLKANSCTVW